MNEQLRDQYNSLYSSKKNVFGEGKPLDVVCRLGDHIGNGKVLDIGGGEGRHALCLAEQGFSVDVIDISEVGLNNLQSLAAEKGLDINAKVVDVTQEELETMYDAVIMTFVLHHMDEASARSLIKMAQEHTVAGGIHIIVTFINEGDLFKRNTTTGRFYPNEEDVEELYRGWNIKEFTTSEVTTYARDKKGERMKNHNLTLVAQNLK